MIRTCSNCRCIFLIAHYLLQRQLHKILKGKKDDGVVHDKKSKNLPIEEGCLSKGNVIIYVWRQKDTEIVTEQLIGAGVSGGVVCYHGGMDANDRSRAQSKVCDIGNCSTTTDIAHFSHHHYFLR